jgi:glutamate racemase
VHELRARIELPILGVVSGLISDATRRSQRTDLLRFAAATGVLLGLFILGLISMAVILNRQVA